MINNMGLPGLIALFGGGLHPELLMGVFLFQLGTIAIPPFSGLSIIAAL
ncbi:hypothetical protein [Aquicoccus sp.]